jgi:NAD(P)-dependent dehydrogenase (short-subunit alcohol dehydrogenase family)
MPSEWTLRDKTCLLTGATSGIGRVAALEIARLGARLFVVGRDRARGEAAVREIREQSGNGKVDLLLADLSSQQSIRGLAGEFLARGEPLHVLVNNAGVFALSRSLTVDGIETVFAVNHLGYFLLTNLLLDRLQQSAPARIVNVASDAHGWGTIDFDDLGGERSYRWMRIYGRSKLANILFTYELARRLEGSGVTVNCLHPGAVATRLGAQNGAIARFLIGLLRPFLRTPEAGADTVIHLAASPELEGVTGKYFVDRREGRSSRESRDPAVARRLWEVSAEMTGVAA